MLALLFSHCQKYAESLSFAGHWTVPHRSGEGDALNYQPLNIGHPTSVPSPPRASVWMGWQVPYLACCLLIGFWVAFPPLLRYGCEPPDVLVTLMLVVAASFLLYVGFGSIGRMGLVWLVTLGPLAVLLLGLSPISKTEYDTSYSMTAPKPPERWKFTERSLESVPSWAIPKVTVKRTPRQKPVLTMSPTDGICRCAYVMAITHTVAMGSMLLWLACLLVRQRTPSRSASRPVVPDLASRARGRESRGRFGSRVEKKESWSR